MQSNNCSLFQGQIQEGKIDVSRLGWLADSYKRIKLKVQKDKPETLKDPFSGFEYRISSHSPAFRSS